MVLFVFRSFYVSSFTNKELTEGTVMLTLLIFNICITMLNALYLACIRGNERYVFEKLLSIISQIIQPILCLMILYKLPYAVVNECNCVYYSIYICKTGVRCKDCSL